MDTNQSTAVEQNGNVETAQFEQIHEVNSQFTKPDITKTTVLLSVTLSRFEVQRKVNNEQVKVDADKSLIKVHKTILDSPELTEIKKLDTDLRNWLRRWTMPSVLKNGVYMVPIGVLEMIDNRLSEFVEKRKELIGAFTEAYPTRKAEAQVRLNNLFDEGQYPKVEEITGQFGQEFSYMSFCVPDMLEGVNKSLFEREKGKLQAKIEEAGKVAQQVVRARFAESVGHLLERLTPDGDGKKKIFRNTCVTNLQEYVDNFSLLNVTNDVELEKLVQQAKDLISGVDPDSVRTDENFREELIEGFTKIDETLASFITTKPSRLIDLTEE